MGSKEYLTHGGRRKAPGKVIGIGIVPSLSIGEGNKDIWGSIFQDNSPLNCILEAHHRVL